MTQETYLDWLTVVGITAIFAAVLAYWTAAFINKRSERWKGHKVYVHLGRDISMEIEGYSPEESHRLALRLIADTQPKVLRIPEQWAVDMEKDE